MTRLLVSGLVVFGVVALWMVGSAWIGWRWLRRRNEVSAAYPTRPPLRWLASPEACGRHHRRLRNAVLLVRSAVPASRRRRHAAMSPLAILAADVEAHAIALDRHLMAAMRVRGRAGMAMRRTIAGHVDQIERISYRLVATAGIGSENPDATSSDEALQSITDRLDALDAAWLEIDRLERGAGLTVPVLSK